MLDRKADLRGARELRRALLRVPAQRRAHGVTIRRLDGARFFGPGALDEEEPEGFFSALAIVSASASSPDPSGGCVVPVDVPSGSTRLLSKPPPPALRR